ncbi:flagellar motor protein MotB [Caulobacter sp. D4A]|uniref:OmpA family protein n=1 Tax=unclassified Caulobacter TaxID=2648921 RepID=UPI000D730101|nr:MULTISPECIES: OmpA family protein [unclassified Caulobacter]PXA85453.1 flagellar motor protein MotB [Caulobacter sp. D4A]PXA89619.1 flagellar motor protein MotB [Caulobacter sp. D5]
MIGQVKGSLKMAAVVALVAGGLAVSGCATKKYVNTQVGGVATRVDGHDTQISELDKTSREALERATAAGKLAEGKFMYSMVLSDDSVKFPTDQDALSPEAEQRLADFASKLKEENKNVYLEIQGYTDATGETDYNEKLGQRRADAVRKYLSRQGVALNRMATISYGSEDPIAPNETKEGRAQNRRVVIMVLA